MLFGEGALRADDALGYRRLGREESTGNFLGCETAKQTEREGSARLGGKNRMAGDEY